MHSRGRPLLEHEVHGSVRAHCARLACLEDLKAAAADWQESLEEKPPAAGDWQESLEGKSAWWERLGGDTWVAGDGRSARGTWTGWERSAWWRRPGGDKLGAAWWEQPSGSSGREEGVAWQGRGKVDNPRDKWIANLLASRVPTGSSSQNQQVAVPESQPPATPRHQQEAVPEPPATPRH